LHAVNIEVFGKACVEMFGPRKRLPTLLIGPAIQTVRDVGPPNETDEALDQRIETAAASARGQQAEPAQVAHEKRRPWGYDVPDGDKWQEKIDARLGIKK
jgi:hypothetical protein